MFDALGELSLKLYSGESPYACLVATDSFMSPQALAEAATRSSIWRPQRDPPSEAAVALFLTTEARARDYGGTLATILDSQTVQGKAHDDNDELIDGIPLTYLLRNLPSHGPLFRVFGPIESDDLRRQEWSLASARTSGKFAEPWDMHDAEHELGRVGAASGALHLAYGIAACRHRTTDARVDVKYPFLCWAISRDGRRGAALVRGVAA
jgi:hypothetical protein